MNRHDLDQIAIRFKPQFFLLTHLVALAFFSQIAEQGIRCIVVFTFPVQQFSQMHQVRHAPFTVRQGQKPLHHLFPIQQITQGISYAI